LGHDYTHAFHFIDCKTVAARTIMVCMAHTSTSLNPTAEDVAWMLVAENPSLPIERARLIARALIDATRDVIDGWLQERQWIVAER
jgi:hypothetical protein